MKHNRQTVLSKINSLSFIIANFFILTSLFTPPLKAAEEGNPSVYWSYDLHDLYSKKVDNTGEGYAPLAELRNFRVVLYGVLYRSGANNVYNKKTKRDNENPLSNQGLQDLCEQNFSKAFYLYKKNYSSATPSVTCKNQSKQENTLQYIQLTGLDRKNEKELLKAIHQTIESPGHPVLIHCWNGWHASGFVSTLALRQFCDFNAEEATSYWIKNTDGNNKGYEKILKRIRDFKPYSDLKISATVKKKICPVVGSAN